MAVKHSNTNSYIKPTNRQPRGPATYTGWFRYTDGNYYSVAVTTDTDGNAGRAYIGGDEYPVAFADRIIAYAIAFTE